MDVPRDLQFKGAGSYWSSIQSKRRAARSEELSTPERSEGPIRQRDRPQNCLPRESRSKAQRTSVACDSPDSMGPIKENGMVPRCAMRDLELTWNPGVKRKATEDPNTPSDSKRIKSSYSEEPESNNILKASNVIPFPEKVSRPTFEFELID